MDREGIGGSYETLEMDFSNGSPDDWNYWRRLRRTATLE
jgi:hypothetical protein